MIRKKNGMPTDFQLTKEKNMGAVANCDHLKNLKYSRSLPYVLTEHGAIMAASVLNTQRAIEVSAFTEYDEQIVELVLIPENV